MGKAVGSLVGYAVGAAVVIIVGALVGPTEVFFAASGVGAGVIRWHSRLLLWVAGVASYCVALHSVRFPHWVSDVVVAPAMVNCVAGKSQLRAVSQSRSVEAVGVFDSY